MTLKNRIKVLGGLAVGVGLGTIGRKLMKAESNLEDENHRLRLHLAKIEEELSLYKEAGKEAVTEGKKAFKGKLESEKEKLNFDDYEEDIPFALDFINYAKKSELIKVPGVGNALSTKIMDERPFYDLEEVREKIERIPEVIFELEEVYE